MSATKTAAKTSRKKTSAKAKVPEMVTLSSVYAVIASRKGIDTTKAGKVARSKMRANFEKVCELSPNVTDHKSSRNDGNRWPTNITRELAEYVIGAPVTE